MTTDLPTKQQTIHLFAYGTLRKGERLHDWVGDEIINDLGEATIAFSRLYYSRNHRGFPFLVETDSPNDKSVGEIYEIPVNENTIAMFQMEMNAGYKVMEMEATLADGSTLPVAVCVWDSVVGEPVPDNNWKSPERVSFWQ